MNKLTTLLLIGCCQFPVTTASAFQELSDGIKVVPYTVTKISPSGEYIDEQRMSILLPGEIGANPDRELDISLGAESVDGIDPSRPDRAPFYENPQLLQKLELTDQQKEELDELKSSFSEEITKIVRKSISQGGVPDESAMKGLKADIIKLRESFQKDASGILLPHQIEILLKGQIQKKFEWSVAGLLTSNTVQEKLNLTERQIAEIKEKEEELNRQIKDMQKKMEDRIKALKEEGVEKILGTLDKSQRKKLDEMLVR